MAEEIISALWAIVSLLAYQNHVVWLCWGAGIQAFLFAMASFNDARAYLLRHPPGEKGKKSDA